MMGRHVFEGSHLRATLFNAGGAALFVTFQHRRADPGRFVPASPKQNALSAGMAHLHVQTRLNDWYIGPDTVALEYTLQDLARRYRRVVGLGFSMGGYAALRFAKALNMAQVLAVSPQYSIAPRHVPIDRRFHADSAGFDPDLGHLDPRGTAMSGLILVDPFRPRDLYNAQLICAAFPAIRIARLAGGGHPASQVLRDGGKFGVLQDWLLEPCADAAQLVTSHRMARCESPVYWHNLAMWAQRSSRAELARHALGRAEALERARRSGARRDRPESLDATGDTA